MIFWGPAAVNCQASCVSQVQDQLCFVHHPREIELAALSLGPITCSNSKQVAALDGGHTANWQFKYARKNDSKNCVLLHSQKNNLSVADVLTDKEGV